MKITESVWADVRRISVLCLDTLVLNRRGNVRGKMFIIQRKEFVFVALFGFVVISLYCHGLTKWILVRLDDY